MFLNNTNEQKVDFVTDRKVFFKRKKEKIQKKKHDKKRREERKSETRIIDFLDLFKSLELLFLFLLNC